MLNASRSHFGRSLWLLLVSAASLVIISACSLVGRDSTLHPLNTYAVEAFFYPSGGSVMRIQIDLLYQGLYHWPAPSESVICDGVKLTSPPDTSTLYAALPMAGPGGMYQCVFTSQGSSAILVIPVVPAPTLITPAAQESLARANRFTIAYAPPASGMTIANVSVLTHFADQQDYEFTTEQTGKETFVVDPGRNLLTFAMGPGSLDITAQVTEMVVPTGGVRSLIATFSLTTSAPVTWT
jgi:hypothetical protein